MRLIVLSVLLVMLAGVIVPGTSADSHMQGTVTVPDLTGLTLPLATAELNRNNLAVGQVNVSIWTPTSPAPVDTIGGQSVAPGQSVEAGTVVNVTMLRAANALLIFDDNDLTLVNNSGANLRLEGIRFTSLDGNRPATFVATEWGDTLRANQCMQMWSVYRNTPKGVDECALIQRNRSVVDPNQHFWTGSNGATQFSVTQNTQERGICNIADGRCAFYLDVPSSDPSVPYIYFAYTTDALMIYNKSENAWMRTAGINVVNDSGVPFNIGAPASYGNPEIVANLRRLAPQQCIVLTAGEQNVEAPEPCNEILRVAVNAETSFWNQSFNVDNRTDEREHRCAAATPDRLTICIMPQ